MSKELLVPKKTKKRKVDDGDEAVQNKLPVILPEHLNMYTVYRGPGGYYRVYAKVKLSAASEVSIGQPDLFRISESKMLGDIQLDIQRAQKGEEK